MFSSDLIGLKALLCSKKPELRLIFPEKIVLKSIIPNRDNLRMNYPLKYPDPPFANEIYTFL